MLTRISFYTSVAIVKIQAFTKRKKLTKSGSRIAKPEVIVSLALD